MPREFPQPTDPIVQAPMAGGPSTPELAAAVSSAGGLGFVAAGYRTPEQLRADIEATRALTDAPIGVNLFLVAETEVDERALAAYAHELELLACRFGAPLGAARYDDDHLDAKLDVVRELRVPIVSFTFACPSPEMVRSLQDEGVAMWVTVTEPEEAVLAAGVGADALICQASRRCSRRAPAPRRSARHSCSSTSHRHRRPTRTCITSSPPPCVPPRGRRSIPRRSTSRPGSRTDWQQSGRPPSSSEPGARAADSGQVRQAHDLLLVGPRTYRGADQPGGGDAAHDDAL